MTAATQIHCAALDGWVTPETAASLAEEIRAAGGTDDVEVFVYEGVDHAFVNEDRPEVYDAAAAHAAVRARRRVLLDEPGLTAPGLAPPRAPAHRW